jgi:hypothetical protein
MKEVNDDFYTPSKWLVIIIIIFIIAVGLFGCKPQMIYVPVESVKTEWRDKIQRDSIHLHDSILIKMKGDTVFIEKYRYLYRDKLIRDSIFKTDSIQVPYPVEVEVEKEVNRPSSFQSFQVWCGRILLLSILGWLGFRYLKK